MQQITPTLILTMSCLVVGALFLHGPIPQDLLYHQFADCRALFNVPNFWNVITNIPFVIIGMMGLFRCTAPNMYAGETENKMS